MSDRAASLAGRALLALFLMIGFFWSGELHPALNGGFRPPMMQGFARFMDAANIRRSVDAVVDQAMAHDTQDPYDTHPPLPERVSALARLPAVAPRTDDDRPAVSLLDDVDALEQELLVALTGDPSIVSKLRSAAWEALGDSLWVPQWRARRDALATARPGIAIETLPGRLDDASVLAVALWGEAAKDAPRELHRQAVAHELAAALAVALIDAGWSVETAVGEPVRLHRGEDHVEPFFAVAQLFAGETSRDA